MNGSTEHFDIVVVGGANYDYLVRGRSLPMPGGTVDGQEFTEAPGGKGANQAVAAVRLGAPTTLIARVGMDERGQKIVNRLISEGVNTEHISYDAQVGTGVALIMVDASGQKQIMADHSANRWLSSIDIQVARDTIINAKVLVAQLEVPIEATAEAMRIAREAGVRIILDPAPPHPLPDDVLAMVDILRSNSGEAEVLSGVKITDRKSAEKAAAALMKRGVGAVMLDVPEAGNLLVWSEGSELLGKYPVDSVDATGAGDALTAGLAVALAENKSWPDAARFASAAAALATTVIGAQAGLPRREAVDELMGSELEAG
jgi:ribokinase